MLTKRLQNAGGHRNGDFNTQAATVGPGSVTVSSKAAGTAARTTCSLGDLSRLTGTDTRTLRQYMEGDPAQGPEKERTIEVRRYRRDDLLRLERLVFLEMLGLTSHYDRQQILAGNNHLTAELNRQECILREVRKRLDRLLYFIDYARDMNCYPWSDDWHSVALVIEAMNKCREWDSMRRLYMEYKPSSGSRANAPLSL